MWQIIANLIGGPLVSGLINAYKAKLEAGNTAERIAADLAQKELAVEQRQAELNTQLTISEEGRWWTAAPRAVVCWSFAIYVFKVVVIDKVLDLGSTTALSGDVSTWAGWVMTVWFGGRSFEKIARIIKR